MRSTPHLIRTSTRLATLCLVLALAACGGEEDKPTPGEGGETNGGAAPTFYFSAIPDTDATSYRAKFEPVAEWLGEQLGVKVVFRHSAKYSDSVDQFKTDSIQAAWFGGLSGVQARVAVPGAQAIIQGDADPDFMSYFIAHKDTGLTASDEFPMGLEGKTFTFGSDGSTSGRLMPEFFIRQETGKSPAEFFGMENHYSGGHPQTVRLVASGEFQAGAVNFKVYDKMVADGEIDPDVCRLIWKTPTYADYNLTIRPDLDERFGEGFTDRLKKAFLECDDETVLAAFRRDKFIPAKNEDFIAIEETARDLGLLR